MNDICSSMKLCNPYANHLHRKRDTIHFMLSIIYKKVGTHSTQLQILLRWLFTGSLAIAKTPVLFQSGTDLLFSDPVHAHIKLV